MKKLFSLEKFIYISIVAMPLYLIKLVILGVPTNVFEIMAIGVGIWSVVARVGSEIDLRDYKRYMIPIVTIIVGATLSMLAGGSYRIGLGIIKSWFVVPIIFAFIVVEKMTVKKILSVLYDSAFLIAVISWGYVWLGKMTYDGRLEAIYNSPNYLAMYLAPAIIIGSSLFSERKKYYTFSLAVIAGAFYLTFSYAAWLAVCVALLGMFFVKEGGWVKWKKIGMTILIILTVVFLQLGTSKFRDLIQAQERSSLSSRMMIWTSAGKIIIDNPFWGIGPGNFQNKYLEYQKYFPPYLEWAVPQPHNVWLAFWLQTGLIGLAGFLSLLFLWFKTLLGVENEGKKVELMVVGTIMLYILVHGLFDTTYFKNDLAVVFWLSIFAGIKNTPKT